MLPVLTAVLEASITLTTIPVIGVELGQTEITALGILMILMLLVGSDIFSSSEIELI